MSDLSIEQQHHPMRSVRLDTLVRLIEARFSRWKD